MHNRDRNNNNLIAQIEALQAELESLHLALQEQQNNLQLGDTVEIINSYHNQRGIVGVITKVTWRQVTLQDNQGNSYRRAKKNVRLVSTQEAQWVLY